MKRILAIVVAVVALGVAACSGQRGSSPLPLSNDNGVAPAAAPARATGPLGAHHRHRRHLRRTTIRIRIPRRKRRFHPLGTAPAYISLATKSLRIHVYTVGGATPAPGTYTDTIFTLTTSNPACTLSSGSLQCTLSAPVPVAAAVALQASIYASTDGSGSPLATTITAAVDTTRSTAQFAITLDGVPVTVYVSTASAPTRATSAVLSAPYDGATHTLSFNVIAADGAGDTIAPPGDYATPLSLSVTTNPNGALTLGSTTIASPGPNGTTAVTVRYSTTASPAPGAIAVTVGSATATIAVDPLVAAGSSLTELAVGAGARSATVYEPGYSGKFTVTGNGSLASVTCNPSDCTPASAGATVTLNVTPLAPGSGALAVSDTNGTSASLPFAIGGPTSGSITVGGYTINSYATSSQDDELLGVIAGPDGHSIWFINAGEPGSVGSIDLNACVPSASCPYASTTLSDANAHPQGLTAASDGNVYVAAPGTSLDGGQLYQVDTASCSTSSCSNVRTYPITSSPQPAAVAQGSDGLLYTIGTQSSNNQMMYVVPAPLYTAPPNPSDTGIVGPTGGANAAMALGGDGNVWAVTGLLPYLLQIQPASQACGDCPYTPTVTQYALTSAGGAPFGGIAAGPGGNVFVVESGSNTIGHFAPSSCSPGDISTCTDATCPIPTLNAGQGSITEGADDNMWFTEPLNNIVGFVRTAAHAGNCSIVELKLPTGTDPGAIAFGPDGNIWFAEIGTDKLGEVVLQSPAQARSRLRAATRRADALHARWKRLHPFHSLDFVHGGRS